MKIIAYFLVGFFALYVVYFSMLSYFAMKKHPLGMSDEGKLAVCPGTPNCVCSEYANVPSYIEPFGFTGSPKKAWADARASIEELGGRVENFSDTYMSAIFLTKLFRFTDDVELRLDTKNSCIQIRSASRAGKGDMGVNRKRMETLRAAFNKKQNILNQEAVK